jgi:phosphinothricin acetyltransferase
MTIRDAEPARDAASCAAIYAPHVEASATSFEEQPPEPSEMAARIECALTTHAWLVAEQDGAVIGYAYATRHRARPAYRWAVDVSLYVAEPWQGQGVGQRLYELLLERLARRRFRVACAGITLPNQASVALHEQLGFVPVGVFRRIGWKEGAWRDVGWWQVDLDPQGADLPAEPPTLSGA